MQDNVTIHLENDIPCLVGDYVTVGHGAILHACTVESYALIGMGAIVLNGAIIKEGATVAAGSVVKENTVVEAYSLYAGAPAIKKKKLSAESKLTNKHWAEKYVKLSRQYLDNQVI